MKTLEDILQQSPVFLNDWGNAEDVMRDFEVAWGVSSIKILFASYGYVEWDGLAWVLFEQGGKLFEVNGSHCSCYGLEGQWKPEEITLEELVFRMERGTFGESDLDGQEFATQLKQFLGL